MALWDGGGIFVSFWMADSQPIQMSTGSVQEKGKIRRYRKKRDNQCSKECTMDWTLVFKSLGYLVRIRVIDPWTTQLKYTILLQKLNESYNGEKYEKND